MTLTVSDTDTGEASFRPASTTTTYGSYTLRCGGAIGFTSTNQTTQPYNPVMTGGGTISKDSFTALSVEGHRPVGKF